MRLWLCIEYERRERVWLVLAQNKISIDNIAARLLIFPPEPRSREGLFLLFDADALFFQVRFIDVTVLVVVDVVEKQRIFRQPVMPHQCLPFAQ